MIKLTNETGIVVTREANECVKSLEQMYGFKVVHTIDNCLIYHDAMYVLENPYGVRLEIVQDNNAEEYINAMHLAIKDYDEAMEEFKANGFELMAEEINKDAKCALIKKEKDVFFVVEHLQ